jgi:hypothetical protein
LPCKEEAALTMLASTTSQAITAWVNGEEGADERLSESTQTEARSHVIEVARRQGGPALADQVAAELDAAELDAAEPSAEPDPAAPPAG